MNKIKEEKILIKDGERIKNIFIQVNLDKSSVSVMSNFSAWENLTLVMEALAITAEQCVKEGFDKKEVEREINDYLQKALKANTMFYFKKAKQKTASVSSSDFYN